MTAFADTLANLKSLTTSVTLIFIDRHVLTLLLQFFDVLLNLS
jgi:hypothetical protein